MTALCKSIKFRSLIDQLSKQEFMQFINKLYDDNKIQLIKTSIFQHFTQSSDHNDDDLNNINSVISNLIQSRKSKSKPLPTTNIKCDQLPLQLIGHIASFLDQSTYFHFQKTNRSIFVGCNAPNMLQQLELIDIDDYKSINLSQYRSLKKLEINIHKFHELALPNNEQFIMNQLDDFKLNAKEEMDADIEPFMNQNCINIENIKTLRFQCFGDSDDPEKEFNLGTFWRLLTRFRNIEYLQLRGIYLNDDIDTNKLKELYPNLKGLTVNGGYRYINNGLLNNFGNNLYFLEHSFGHTDLKNVEFNKLEQLVLVEPDMNTINNILKTARNLQKVYIMAPSQQNEDELKTVIPQILKCKSLQFLRIATNKHFTAILEGIRFGLHETKKWERKQLKISVRLNVESDVDIKTAIYNIESIIFRLESSKIRDFMFIWHLRGLKKQKLNKRDILNDLNDISSNVEVNAYGSCFVITNKKCKINGWSASWMISI